jgi:hypothetical protein
MSSPTRKEELRGGPPPGSPERPTDSRNPRPVRGPVDIERLIKEAGGQVRDQRSGSDR